jgi:hypothetical protein
VDDEELAALVEEADRPHEGATRRCPVAGMHVDVPRPETDGAVVRVAVASDVVVALGAAEVLAGAREAPRQEAPRFVEPNGGAPGRSVCGIAVEGAGVRSSKPSPPESQGSDGLERAATESRLP